MGGRFCSRAHARRCSCRDNARRARAWIRNRRAHRDGGARAEDRFDRSAGSVRRPPGSVCAGPSATRGHGGRRGGLGSACSRPTAPARARDSVPLERRRSGSSVRRRRWRLVSRSTSSAVSRTREQRSPGRGRPCRPTPPLVVVGVRYGVLVTGDLDRSAALLSRGAVEFVLAIDFAISFSDTLWPRKAHP